VIGPSLDRLDRTFPDLATVRAFWAEHPAVGPWVDSPAVAAHLARDVTGTPPELRSSVVREAVRADGADVLDNELLLEATGEFRVPTTLLWAPRGMLGDPPGLYDEVRLAAMGLPGAGVTAREVPGTDHWSILWSDAGAAAVAGAVRTTLSR
jgi:pimeloyl-ACP methyl ester carboxylesterase